MGTLEANIYGLVAQMTIKFGSGVASDLHSIQIRHFCHRHAAMHTKRCRC